MTDDGGQTGVTSTVRHIAWGQALLGGAVLGGIGWGVFAVSILGSAGDQVHLEAIIGPHVFNAAVVTLVVVFGAGVLGVRARRGGARADHLSGVAMALVVAAASGWVVLGLQYLQAVVLGAW